MTPVGPAGENVAVGIEVAAFQIERPALPEAATRSHAPATQYKVEADDEDEDRQNARVHRWSHHAR
jgi:hypothetical protein